MEKRKKNFWILGNELLSHFQRFSKIEMQIKWRLPTYIQKLLPYVEKIRWCNPSGTCLQVGLIHYYLLSCGNL